MSDMDSMDTLSVPSTSIAPTVSPGKPSLSRPSGGFMASLPLLQEHRHNEKAKLLRVYMNLITFLHLLSASYINGDIFCIFYFYKKFLLISVAHID